MFFKIGSDERFVGSTGFLEQSLKTTNAELKNDEFEERFNENDGCWGEFENKPELKSWLVCELGGGEDDLFFGTIDWVGWFVGMAWFPGGRGDAGGGFGSWGKLSDLPAEIRKSFWVIFERSWLYEKKDLIALGIFADDLRVVALDIEKKRISSLDNFLNGGSE